MAGGGGESGSASQNRETHYLWGTYMPDPPSGEKSHGISAHLMVLRQGMPVSVFEKIDFFFNFRYIGSFWDIAAENKPLLWEGTIAEA